MAATGVGDVATRMDGSVVIPTKDRPPALMRCLRALLSTKRAGLRVIVVGAAKRAALIRPFPPWLSREATSVDGGEALIA